MKSSIHPQWNRQAVVTCSCGSTFTTGSTQDSIVVDICSACHPFYTGEMKFVDRQKRVDKFLKKMQVAQEKQEIQAQKSPKTVVAAGDAKSYQDILREQQQTLKQASKKTA